MDPKIWEPLAALPQPEHFKNEVALANERLSVAGVYILLNSKGEAVYVGQSADIQKRVRQHRRDPAKTFTTVEYYQIDSEVSRLQVEGILILALRPKHNRALALGLSPGRIWELAYTFNAHPRRRKAPSQED